jgi:hypothetical protein
MIGQTGGGGTPRLLQGSVCPHKEGVGGGIGGFPPRGSVGSGSGGGRKQERKVRAW